MTRPLIWRACKTMTGIKAFLDMLADVGVEHIFGYPGTTELPLNDGLLARSDIQYILALQEQSLIHI